MCSCVHRAEELRKANFQSPACLLSSVWQLRMNSALQSESGAIQAGWWLHTEQEKAAHLRSITRYDQAPERWWMVRPEALSPTITHTRHEFLQVLIVQAGVQGFFSSATFLEKHISYVVLAKGHPFTFAESAFVLPEGLEVGSNLAKGRDPFRSRVTWIMSFKNDLHKTTFFLAHQPRQS